MRKQGIRSVSPIPQLAGEPGLLADVPGVIAHSGRVAGFEHLRDRVLADWELFIASGMAAYNALKLVIELDRHAMFAAVQEAKTMGTEQDAYTKFMRYLEGDEVAVTVEGEVATDPAEVTSIDDIFEAIDEGETNGKQ